MLLTVAIFVNSATSIARLDTTRRHTYRDSPFNLHHGVRIRLFILVIINLDQQQRAAPSTKPRAKSSMLEASGCVFCLLEPERNHEAGR